MRTTENTLSVGLPSASTSTQVPASDFQLLKRRVGVGLSDRSRFLAAAGRSISQQQRTNDESNFEHSSPRVCES